MAFRVPDVIVGVDFGMTCTGVAYSIAPWSDPKIIQNWPSHRVGPSRNKVPTAISYDRTGQAIADAWGFNTMDKDFAGKDDYWFTARHFKLFIDAASQPNVSNPVPVEHARQYYQDYLTSLYQHIMAFFKSTFPRSESRNFEFLFSTPTTWDNPSQIAELKRLIEGAGFGGMPNHQVVISVTEAEAAAIYASKLGYAKDEVVLVCDAGGGTTDVNIFKVIENDQAGLQLNTFTHVEGENVGSIFIDWRIEQLISIRLQSLRQYLTQDPEAVADAMISEGRFELFKCGFTNDQSHPLYLPIEGMQAGLHFQHAGVDDSKMVITCDEFKQAFDEQIDRMFALIDRQLVGLANSNGNEKVSFLVLSGGLGSSPYVRNRFVRKYQSGAGGLPWNAQAIEVLDVPDPQLAVVQGLVSGRVQELRGQQGIFAERRARNSYGILCRKVYDRHKFRGEDVSEDSRDKMIWAERQIDWLVRQGQPINVERGVSMPFRHKIDLGQETQPFQIHIVKSGRDPHALPRSLKQDGAEVLCALKIKLDQRDMERKNHRWHDRGLEHYIADFTIKIMLEAAELKFMVLGRDGTRRDIGAHKVIQVDWYEPGNRTQRGRLDP